MALRYLDVTPPRPPMEPLQKWLVAGMALAGGIILARVIAAVVAG